MKKDKFFAIGVMSGTSFDGIDISLISSDGKKYFKPIKSSFYKFSSKIREKLIKISKNFDNSQYKLGLLHSIELDITQAYIDSIRAFISKNRLKKIDLIGIHGQTIFHNPKNRISLQLVDPKFLCKEIKIKVVYNFRQNDMKFGGEGAPLVPIFHKMLSKYLDLKGNIVFINLGGISNLTYIPQRGKIEAYDIGPGMTLLDQYVYLKKKKRFDLNGNFSLKGKVNSKVLRFVLKDKYFNLRSPKSLDKFYFSLVPFKKLSFNDACATISSFTAKSILQELDKFNVNKVIVSGGGIKNKHTLDTLKKSLKSNLCIIDEFNLDKDFIEAQAFAYLAIRRCKMLPISYPKTTGVSHPVSGGKILNYR